nr:reverse transcriptase domain-containing protein [Tanacetum cinerariifolium]
MENVQDMSGCSIDQKVKYTAGSFVGKALTWWNSHTGAWPKCTTCNSYHAPRGPCRTFFNCNHSGHLAKDYRGVPRNMNPVNARNQPGRACYECGSTDHVRPACPRLNRVQGLGGNRPNQVVANNEGQGIEPKELDFKYEIKIASGQLVKIDKIIKGCRLEIKGHVFDIDLISFEHRSFDVIIGMDWLSNHKSEIIYHERVVRIPLLDGKEIKFQIELIPGATLVVKSPYRLAPSELEKLSGQLKEIQDKDFIRPSSSP